MATSPKESFSDALESFFDIRNPHRERQDQRHCQNSRRRTRCIKADCQKFSRCDNRHKQYDRVQNSEQFEQRNIVKNTEKSDRQHHRKSNGNRNEQRPARHIARRHQIDLIREHHQPWLSDGDKKSEHKSRQHNHPNVVGLRKRKSRQLTQRRDSDVHPEQKYRQSQDDKDRSNHESDEKTVLHRRNGEIEQKHQRHNRKHREQHFFEF